MSLIILFCAILSLAYMSIVLFLYGGIRQLSPSTAANNLKFSVVVASHNEESGIEQCLASVLSQSIDTGRFEVICVNDRSTDATAAIASALAARRHNLSVVTVAETPMGVSPKKHAVLAGISRARNEIIVFTDADCRVAPTWLDTIDRYMTPDTGFVQGITAYEYVPGMNRFFFGLQALDFCSHAVVSAAAIGAGLPINSNANNCAFRKKAFEDAAGYGKDAVVISGDDDMLLQRIWKKTSWRIRYMADLSGAVRTLPTPTIGGVFEQRKRWGSKTIHYGMRQVAVLSGVFAFYCAIVALVGAGIFMHRYLAIAGCMVIVKIAGEALLMIPGTRIMGQTALRKYLVFGSLVQLPVVIGATVLGVFWRFAWKGQTFARKASS